MAKKPPLTETAKLINAHLKRFERDPAINLNTMPDRSGLSLYYCAGAGVSGRYVWVKYISYQNASHLTRADAEAYLKKLDEGFVGRHWEALGRH
jgi:hypothetical protein